MNTTPQLTPEQAAALKKDPEAAAVFIEESMRDRPKGWSRRSTASYYSEEFGQHVKDIFDQMLDTKQDVLIPLKRNRSVDTLYLMLHQGCKYLLENMDTDNKYAILREAIIMRRKKGVGVLVEYKQADEKGLGAVILDKKPDRAEWRDRMEVWLNDSKVGEHFKVEGLLLSPQEIKELKITFHGIKSVICNVTAFSVKLLRIE